MLLLKSTNSEWRPNGFHTHYPVVVRSWVCWHHLSCHSCWSPCGISSVTFLPLLTPTSLYLSLPLLLLPLCHLIPQPPPKCLGKECLLLQIQSWVYSFALWELLFTLILWSLVLCIELILSLNLRIKCIFICFFLLFKIVFYILVS